MTANAPAIFPFFFLIIIVTTSCSSSLTAIQKVHREFDKGQRHADEGRFADARKSYSRAIKIDSMVTAPYGAIVETYLAENRPDRAWTFLSGIPRSIRTLPEISFFRGITAARQRRFNEAIADLQWSIKANYNRAEAAFVLAEIYHQTEDYERAFDLLEPLKDSTSLPQFDKVVALYRTVKNKYETFLRSSFEGRMIKTVSGAPRVTRAQLAFLLVQELQPTATGKPLSFADVAAGDSLAKFCSHAVSSGLLEVLPDHRFYPKYVVRRRNVAYYLQRYAGRQDDASGSDGNKVPGDVGRNDPQFMEIMWAMTHEILNLRADLTFRPDEPVTGEELITAIKKARDLK